ncbi:hypothetical protein [Aeromonas veronii]|uniref:hypothetical protein n=1 Tax=Aeromonas veronii TaxID=654 RepID=UPI001302265B|nr:hypothetical protein [Aeromonas veronii]KAE9622543.1 hypothetical protein GO627_20670 [Aeromonas veronii]
MVWCAPAAGPGSPRGNGRAAAGDRRLDGGRWPAGRRDLDGLVRSCCWPGGMVEQLQVIAASMAGAGQLVAGSVDLMYLVALAFDGHGVPVSSRRAPAVPVATVPGQVVIWMVWCAPAAGPG